MPAHGIQTDAKETPEYMSAAEREAYRVIFKDGRAHHFKYEVSGDTTIDLVRHDTTGGKAALKAATCPGDVFLRHNGNWATILRVAGVH